MTASVVSLTDFANFANAGHTSTLVLVDMHHGSASTRESLTLEASVLQNCRQALLHARRLGLSVAFVRRLDPVSSFAHGARYPRWIEGFEPGRADMVFDRQFPSCYESQGFSDMMKHAAGNYVLAGLFGESTCLATAVDAFHRGHRFTYLADASMSRAFDEVDAAAMHKVTTKIISLYGTVAETNLWIRGSARKVQS